MIPESQIGKNIKSFRLSQKLTIKTLAEKTGITKGHLSKVENSEKAPPVSTLLVIEGTMRFLHGEDEYIV